MGISKSLQIDNWELSYFSPAQKNDFTEKLKSMNIKTYSCTLNDRDSFKTILSEVNPNIVFCDTFLAEEQFGWSIKEFSNNIPIVIDTQDIHSLRTARHTYFKSGKSVTEVKEFNDLSTSPLFVREMASILRSDLSIVCSSFEQKLLIEKYNIPKFKVPVISFFYSPETYQNYQDISWNKRKNFFMLGNFIHEPNKDAIKWAKSIWPLIREKIPKAELHIYGAKHSRDVYDLRNNDMGFKVRGFISEDELYNTLAKYRVQIAPLRFGAGIKGKIADSWCAGVPSVTTSIGAEGMNFDNAFGGVVEDSEENIAKAAVQLYKNRDVWESASAAGYSTLKKYFSHEINSNVLIDSINFVVNNLEKIRKENYIGAILDNSALNHNKYMSKYLSTKSKLEMLMKSSE